MGYGLTGFNTPAQVAESYGYNKQRIAAAVQAGVIDPTVGLMAGMLIDKARSAAAEEQAPQTTVAQDIMAPVAPAMPPMPGAIPQQGVSPVASAAPPQAVAAPMSAPAAPTAQPVMRAAAGGLAELSVPDYMFDENAYRGGGVVAFQVGGATNVGDMEDYELRLIARSIDDPRKEEAATELRLREEAAEVRRREGQGTTYYGGRDSVFPEMPDISGALRTVNEAMRTPEDAYSRPPKWITATGGPREFSMPELPTSEGTSFRPGLTTTERTPGLEQLLSVRGTPVRSRDWMRPEADSTPQGEIARRTTGDDFYAYPYDGPAGAGDSINRNPGYVAFTPDMLTMGEAVPYNMGPTNSEGLPGFPMNLPNRAPPTGGAPPGAQLPAAQLPAAQAPAPFDEATFVENYLAGRGDMPAPPGSSDEEKARQRDQDIGMALLSAAASGLSSGSPTLFGALGAAAQGATPAIRDALAAQRAEASDERKAQYEYELAQYGLKGKALDAAVAEKIRLEDQAYRERELALEERRAEDLADYYQVIAGAQRERVNPSLTDYQMSQIYGDAYKAWQDYVENSKNIAGEITVDTSEEAQRAFLDNYITFRRGSRLSNSPVGEEEIDFNSILPPPP